MLNRAQILNIVLFKESMFPKKQKKLKEKELNLETA